MRGEWADALRLTSFAQGIRLGRPKAMSEPARQGESNGCEVLTKFPKALKELIVA